MLFKKKQNEKTLKYQGKTSKLRIVQFHGFPLRQSGLSHRHAKMQDIKGNSFAAVG